MAPETRIEPAAELRPEDAEPEDSALPFEDRLLKAAAVYQSFRGASPDEPTTRLEELAASFQTAKVHPACADLFLDAFRRRPAAADRLANSLFDPPKANQTFLDFKLLRELGRGALGRVFLAQQGELADRLVALKIAASVQDESQALAQLQHPHIVPIHSVHYAGAFQAVCMPYLGSTTLADVLHEIRKHDSAPGSGRDLLYPIRSSRSSLVLSPLRSAPNGEEFEVSAPGVSEVPASSWTPPLERTSKEARSKQPSGWALELISNLDFVPAVLWIGARLADGLAFAHDTGIIHGDLKPANVLMTDDGQPMLLDFNLATDLKSKSAAEAWAGGTLPYMAPEHLQALLNQTGYADVRCDIYSLGVILYELLTGRRPFPIRSGHSRDAVSRMIEDRSASPPGMRRWNRAITPSAKAIILRCLAANPDERYATARELYEDLTRQLEHRSLKHAAEPISQKARKWLRRHRLRSIGFAIAASFAICWGVWQSRADRLSRDYDRIARTEARRAAIDRLNNALLSARTLLCDPSSTTDLIKSELARDEAVLEEFGAANWRSHSFAQLTTMSASVADLQTATRDDLCELAMLAARASARLAPPAAPDRERRIKAALEFNALAEAIHSPDPIPPAIWSQRARLEDLAGRPEEAKSWRAKAAERPPQSRRERYLAILDQFEDAQYQQALQFLRQASLDDAANPQSWLLLGNLYLTQSMPDDALLCFDNAIKLNPNLRDAFRNRGILRLNRREFAKAETDFTETIQLGRSLAIGWHNRALARSAMGRTREAIEDLTFAIRLPDAQVRCWLLRAEERGKLGDLDGAAQDRAEAMRRVPSDEASWVSRGLARLSRGLGSPQYELELALADIDEGLKLNPIYAPGLFNRGSVLAALNRNLESIAAFDQVLRVSPNALQALTGRSVLRARDGMREPAIQDAERALNLDGSADTLYRAACVFALTSRQSSTDAARAVDLLGQALKVDSMVWLPIAMKDSDLDPIRGSPEFQSLLQERKKSRIFPRKND